MATSVPSVHQNRLARETSPYLLQHQHNPVDWWAWGPDALAEAKRTNKPILLSVGYAACHWCHVMAHESFEDEATAAVMNELFVNIKVDREERPDIDQIYMHALHMLGEQGGWPLTMFLTPAGEPVWGGTYFPKESRYGRPAFTAVCRELARVFREEPERIAKNRDALMQRLSAGARAERPVTIGLAGLDDAATQLGRMIDQANGGLRGAPKFPQSTMLENLWRTGLRRGENRFFDLVELSLDHMCRGGIYDHLGGGFSRYSVDERWLVPHFEKMLYDNAQLLELLALAHRRSGNPLFRQRASETVDWLKREMVTAEGAFAASLDADSEGEEGKFYVWSRQEVDRLLGPADAVFFAEHYDVTAGGNFEGHNIINQLNGLPRSMDDEARLAALRHKLFEARERRVRPGLDDKVLADWNGLMIAGLVNAGVLLGAPDWIALAAHAFSFVASSMTRQDRLGHAWRAGRLVYPGLSPDFAAMVRAALALHEATGDQAYLARAVAWQSALEHHYIDAATGRYFLTADDAEGLVVRPHSTLDEAIPNHNALIAQNLVRLAALTGDPRWRERVDRLFDGLLPLAVDNVFSHVSVLNALDLRLRAAEIVVTGPDMAALAQAALAIPYIDRIVVRAPTDAELSPGHPARAKLQAVPSGAAFVCVGERCSLPVHQPDAIAGALAAMRG
ncbi:MAG TPA: thioredoxin domain-containing protein [Xanthobacteraceae bacterium]|nr:thioredoxin domain-containing protein [Xanthobacteraceae bacterium]